jgi:hypothetical protein
MTQDPSGRGGRCAAGPGQAVPGPAAAYRFEAELPLPRRRRPRCSQVFRLLLVRFRQPQRARRGQLSRWAGVQCFRP